MLLVTRASPEVTNLLGLDITGSKRRTIKRRSRNLQDRQRGGNVVQELSDTWDTRDKRRQRETLADGDQRRQRNDKGLHLDLCGNNDDDKLDNSEHI